MGMHHESIVATAVTLPLAPSCLWPDVNQQVPYESELTVSFSCDIKFDRMH
jgi:hypothetical protein